MGDAADLVAISHAAANRAALLTALVICVGTLGVTALTAGAQSSNEKPTATDVGITDKEIHIAVIADVDNTIVPNLFKGSADGAALSMVATSRRTMRVPTSARPSGARL